MKLIAVLFIVFTYFLLGTTWFVFSIEEIRNDEPENGKVLYWLKNLGFIVLCWPFIFWLAFRKEKLP